MRVFQSEQLQGRKQAVVWIDKHIIICGFLGG